MSELEFCTRARDVARLQSLLAKDDYKAVHYLLIFALLLFHTATTHLWLSYNTQIIAWDPIGHFFNAVHAYEILGSTAGWQLVFRLATFSSYYPPFVYLVSIPFISLGHSLYWATMTNVVFLAITLFCTYGIATRLFANRTAALLSVLLVGMYPQVFAIARIYLLDLGLTAIVAATFYFLVDPAVLENKVRLSILGMTLGFGMLTKWTFPIYVLTPVIYSLLVPVLKKSQAMKRFLLLVTIAGAISLPWYATHIMDLKTIFYFASAGATTVRGDVPPSPVIGLSYIVLLINNQVSLVFFLLFVAGLVALLRIKGTPRPFLLLSYSSASLPFSMSLAAFFPRITR